MPARRRAVIANALNNVEARCVSRFSARKKLYRVRNILLTIIVREVIIKLQILLPDLPVLSAVFGTTPFTGALFFVCGVVFEQRP